MTKDHPTTGRVNVIELEFKAFAAGIKARLESIEAHISAQKHIISSLESKVSRLEAQTELAVSDGK